MSPAKKDSIRLEIKGPVGTILLDRPDKRNAMTEEMLRLLPELVIEAEEDDAVRVLVVRGTGGHFSAGADLNEFGKAYATPEGSERHSTVFARSTSRLAMFSKPSIALIDGVCVGGGCAVALACDIRFASQRSSFAITPSKVGLVYPFEDARRLALTIGYSAAKDMLYSSRVIDAAEALNLRMVTRVYAENEIEKATEAYIKELVNASATSQKITKIMLSRAMNGQAGDDGFTRQLFRDAFDSEDFREGYQAFLEKRDPNFK